MNGSGADKCCGADIIAVVIGVGGEAGKTGDEEELRAGSSRIAAIIIKLNALGQPLSSHSPHPTSAAGTQNTG